MSAQPEALRLADLWEKHSHGYARTPEARTAAELRRLHTDAEESEALRERLSELLRNTAIALRGPEPELTRWSWHDLPDLAAALKAQRDALRAELKEATEAINDPAVNNLRTLAESIRMLSNQRDALLEALELAADFLEHSTEFRIGHPGFEGAQAKARAAIKAVEGENT